MDSKDIWIQEGYKVFALEGINNIKIIRLANSLGRNKSSFYHYFATIEIFIDELLELHLSNSNNMAVRIRENKTLDDLIQTLLYHKIDLLFNRQLRIHRDVEEFKVCFIKTNEFVGQSFLPLWSTLISLEDKSYLARLVLQLSLENFMLQITSENLNKHWLKDYFTNIQLLIKQLKNNP